MCQSQIETHSVLVIIICNNTSSFIVLLGTCRVNVNVSLKCDDVLLDVSVNCYILVNHFKAYSNFTLIVKLSTIIVNVVIEGHGPCGAGF